jgi:ABC-type multidrug transport system ATPase subunit
MIEAFRLGLFSRGKILWDGLDFALDDGAVWVIVGPPASGKTLLLAVLRGERRPDAGDVLISGESLYRGRAASARAFRAACGAITERPDGDGRMTVEGLFLRSALVWGGIDRRERKERQGRLLTIVGLAGTEPLHLSSLSASERARARLAAELVRSPKFLFGDGMVSSAGLPFQEMLGALFRALAGEGNTVVLAERLLPARWASLADEGRTAGPFRIFRLSDAAAKAGSP